MKEKISYAVGMNLIKGILEITVEQASVEIDADQWPRYDRRQIMAEACEYCT